MYLHGYICECPNRMCKERIRLTQAEYADLSKYGAVVSPECGKMDERRSLLSLPVLRVLPTKMRGGGDVGL